MHRTKTQESKDSINIVNGEKSQSTMDENDKVVKVQDTEMKKGEEQTENKTGNNLQRNDECTICMDKKCDAVALPCRHGAFCYECIVNCKSREGICPICREPIKDTLKIFK